MNEQLKQFPSSHTSLFTVFISAPIVVRKSCSNRCNVLLDIKKTGCLNIKEPRANSNTYTNIPLDQLLLNSLCSAGPLSLASSIAVMNCLPLLWHIFQLSA